MQLYVSPSEKAYQNFLKISGALPADCIHVTSIGQLEGYHPKEAKIIRGKGFEKMDKNVIERTRELDARIVGLGLSL